MEWERLTKDTVWRDRQISGLLSMEGEFRGSAREFPQSLEGGGRVQVANGQLFQLPLLKGLADVLRAPALRRGTFREAAGTFTVQQQTLSSSDLTVYGDLATLTAQGSIGPADAVDAHVVAFVDPTAFEHSPEFARWAGQFLLRKAGHLVAEIHIKGTLADPKPEVVPLSLSRLLKEQFGRILGLLGGRGR